MKNTVKFLLPVLLFISCVDVNQNKKYVISNFEYFTDTPKNYRINKLKFESNQSYLEVSNISSEDINKLRRKFKFVSADSMHNLLRSTGKPLIFSKLYDMHNLSGEYEYLLIYDYDVYGYYFMGLLKDNSKLFACENFPELPPGLFRKPSFLN